MVYIDVDVEEMLQDIDFSKADEDTVASGEDVLSVSKRLLAQNKEAYEVLAK